jgi:hypothetical protein
MGNGPRWTTFLRSRNHEARNIDQKLDLIIELLFDVFDVLTTPVATIVFQRTNMTQPVPFTPGPISIADNQSVPAGIALSNNPNALTVESVVWSVVGTDATSTPSADTLTDSVAGVSGADGDTTLNAAVTLSDGSVVNATTVVTTTAPVAPVTAAIVFGTPS